MFIIKWILHPVGMHSISMGGKRVLQLILKLQKRCQVNFLQNFNENVLKTYVKTPLVNITACYTT
jgi:hypothetical protein